MLLIKYTESIFSLLFWICEYSSLQNKRYYYYYYFFRVSQVSEGKRKVAWAWCARHVQWGKARKWSFGCVSRGGMEQEMVCGQAVLFTRLSRRACLALYARFTLA